MNVIITPKTEGQQQIEYIYKQQQVYFILFVCVCVKCWFKSTVLLKSDFV